MARSGSEATRKKIFPTTFPAPWWRHEMETFYALLSLCAGNSPVTGEFPVQRPVTQSFDVFFDLRLNKRLSKQSLGWCLETPSRSSWRQCNAFSIQLYHIAVIQTMALPINFATDPGILLLQCQWSDATEVLWLIISCRYQFGWIHTIHLRIIFNVPSLGIGHHRTSTSEVTKELV